MLIMLSQRVSKQHKWLSSSRLLLDRWWPHHLGSWVKIMPTWYENRTGCRARESRSASPAQPAQPAQNLAMSKKAEARDDGTGQKRKRVVRAGSAKIHLLQVPVPERLFSFLFCLLPNLGRLPTRSLGGARRCAPVAYTNFGPSPMGSLDEAL